MPTFSSGGFNGGTITQALTIDQPDATAVPLRVNGTSGMNPLATVLEVDDDSTSGIALLYVTHGGQVVVSDTGLLVVSGRAAPADSALLAAQASIWYDSTNGASKLMVKAKSANGTVVTGAVNLA